VTNGILNDSVTTFGTVVKVNCNTGYINISNTPIVCDADGIWSGNLSCEPVGNVILYHMNQLAISY
jgi:hypothetical protein